MSFTTIDGGRGILPGLSVEIDFTNGPKNATRVWTDVTADVRSLSYTRSGRSDVLQRTSTGALTAVLNNSAGDYDPTNTAGAYYPGVKRLRWIRVRAQWSSVTYARWQGLITSYVQSWPSSGRDAICTIVAADALKVLSLFDLAGETFVEQTTDARVAAVCDLAGLDSDVDTAAASTLVAVSSALPQGSSALAHLQDVEETENGRLFAGAAGTIVFQGRHYRLLNSGTSLGTIGDDTGEIPYRDASLTSDDANIWNSVAVTTTNADGSAGSTATAENSVSDDDYYTRQLNRTILSDDTDEALSAAEYLAALYGDPAPKLPAITLLPQTSTSAWPTVLAADNGDRFTWKRRAAETIETEGFIEQIAESVSVDHVSWNTTIQMLPADDQFGWVLGDSTYGLLGETTRLIY
jgi:hypothetical protein